MYILIGADLVPTKSNIDLFIQSDRKSLIGEGLIKVFDKAALRVFNLEIPLTDSETPIIKEGPNLIASIDTINGYKALGVDLLTLANNHILDQDVQGLESSVECLNKAGIEHVGSGKNIQSASRPFIYDFNGRRIGFYACVEHEFSLAEKDKPGANAFDPLWSFDHVFNLKSDTDFVIVLYHGGKEHYRYPSPMLQKICRRFVEKGADLVICQHSHCIGCEENYLDGTIVYGQGNFIFDDSDEECWQTSLLVKIEDDFTVSYLPLVKVGNGVRLADAKRGEEIMQEFHSRSVDIIKPGFIEEQYKQFADSALEFYLKALSGKKSIWFRVLNKISGGRYMNHYLLNTYGVLNKVRIFNYIDCEAHRELLLQAMKNGYKR